MSQLVQENSAIEKVRNYIENQADLDLLRFITCGSVDDGKSTLIGRMLYEAQSLFEDQIAALKADSRKVGTQGDEIDFALLVDGLAAEREQGITIDVAYRYFNTDKRKFIVADTPGHEQYTRNMVTGASKADVAVILIDSTQGVLTQTKRHSFITSLLGIKHVVLAVNKMDLVDFNEQTFDNIVEDYNKFAVNLHFHSITAIPVSALFGDNIVERSSKTTWYSGPTLLGYLETIEVEQSKLEEPFRYSVQWVNRPNSTYRGYAGNIISGKVNKNDQVRILPSGELANIESIQLYKSQLESAVAGQSVTLTLNKEIDVTRGDVIVSANSPSEVSDQFEVSLIWMDSDRGFVGRSYWLLIGAMRVNATITNIKYKYNINSFEKLQTRSMKLNDIGEATISLDRPIPFETYASCKSMGAFVLVDRYNFATVAAGMINFSLRRAQNVHRQALSVDKCAREKLNGHRGKVLWFTGLSGSGKSTVANAVEQALHRQGMRTYILDGDNVRQGLNNDLGFTDADRVENIRRIAEVSKLMVDAGLVVLTAFISPFRSERDMARSLFDEGEFLEIHVDVPLEIAETRDPKGLYKKARKGELPNFTGIDSAYEQPKEAELVLATGDLSVEQCVDQVLQAMEE